MPEDKPVTLQIRSVNPAKALGFKHAALDAGMTHAEFFEHIFDFWSRARPAKEERKERTSVRKKTGGES